jgi:hypothetical protein
MFAYELPSLQVQIFLPELTAKSNSNSHYLSFLAGRIHFVSLTNHISQHSFQLYCFEYR